MEPRRRNKKAVGSLKEDDDDEDDAFLTHDRPRPRCPHSGINDVNNNLDSTIDLPLLIPGLKLQQPKDTCTVIAATSKASKQHNNNRNFSSLTKNHGLLIQEIDEDEDNDDDDDDDDRSGCLHCRMSTSPSDIQVRCYECSGYICNSCHWCHEFQANHEIRVCDRCDAFYCRTCDEMDQCDDCGEVVCASCSTLLSCKFCGGGLCEECATACGRCGIVLCSRDAKFAVECDTCRLPYCLVCLASGAKDPCVRCGHRPSKRMEQLVHLRLKSIYKAFKQSSGSISAGQDKSRLTQGDDDDDDDDYYDGDRGDPEALFHAAASASKGAASAKKKKQAAAIAKSHASLASERVERYEKEKEKADAAAAALLAELEEEEENAKSKKSKKKKKKERLLAKKDDEEKELQQEQVARIDQKQQQGSSRKKKPPGRTDSVPAAAASAADRSHRTNVSRKPWGTISVGSENSQMDDDPDDARQEKESRGPAVVEVEEDQAKSRASVDPLEQELCTHVADNNMEGVEKILLDSKGVPGRAALRKNAKKALKRMRMSLMEQAETDDKEKPCHSETTANDVAAAVPAVSEVVVPSKELLSLVSLTHNKASSTLGSGGVVKSRSNSSAAPRSECVMSMAPAIVGWVIGKGGQRIRELMDESGARVWIDQDSMVQHEPRLVYVSGQRNSVETAVRLIKDLVAKAPTGSSLPVVDSSRAGKPLDEADAPGSAVDDSGMERRQEIKQRRVDNNKGETKHVMTCDARFVPLLIGRRGWTIKNIQDSSSAWVDIDQSVTPRRITISGKKEHVDIAVGMVLDVLSYPQAQLQSGTQDSMQQEKPAVADNDTPLNTAPPAPEPIVPPEQEPKPEPMVSPVDEKARPHSSPPSSLIMTNDAKSTVSASSSLSSTPEPSMAPLPPKGIFVQGVPGTMLPPISGHFSGSELPEATSFDPAPRGQQTGLMGNIPVYSSSEDPYFRLPPASFDQGRLLPNGGAPVTDMQHPAQSGGLPGPAPSFGLGHQSAMYQQPPVLQSLPGPVNRQHGIHLQPQPGPYLPPQAGLVAPTNGLGNHMPRLGNLQRSSINAAAVGGPGLWDQPRPPTLSPHKSEGFHLDAAVDFLQHNRESHRSNSMHESVDSLVRTHNSATGVVVHEPRADLPTTPLSAIGREDSNLIDSLFGPPKGSVSETSVLNSLYGLSLSDVDNEKPPMWGVPESDGISRLAETRPSTLFSYAQPSQHAAHNQHPAHSRFAWGEDDF